MTARVCAPRTLPAAVAEERLVAGVVAAGGIRAVGAGSGTAIRIGRCLRVAWLAPGGNMLPLLGLRGGLMHPLRALLVHPLCVFHGRQEFDGLWRSVCRRGDLRRRLRRSR